MQDRSWVSEKSLQHSDADNTMERVRRILNGRALPLFLLCCGFIGLSSVFTLMWIKGAVEAVEPVAWIRGLELGICVLVALYAFWQLLRDVHRS